MIRNERIRKRRGPPATAEELRAYIPYLVNRLSNRLSLDQARLLGDYGINNVVLRALSVLYIYKTLTVNEISVLAVTEQSTASRTVDAMVEAGWVKREFSAADQRRRDIAMTDAGEALLKEVWPLVASAYARLIDDVDAEELQICARVLSKMVDNIRKNEI